MADPTILLRILEFVALLIPTFAIILQLIYQVLVRRNDTGSVLGVLTFLFAGIAFLLLLNVAHKTIEALIETLPETPYTPILSDLRGVIGYFVFAILFLLVYSYRIGKNGETTMKTENQSSLNEYTNDE